MKPTDLMLLFYVLCMPHPMIDHHATSQRGRTYAAPSFEGLLCKVACKYVRVFDTRTLHARCAPCTSSNKQSLVWWYSNFLVCTPISVGMKAYCLPKHMHRSHQWRLRCKWVQSIGNLIALWVGENVIHAVYNWIHNIAFTFSVFLFRDDQTVQKQWRVLCWHIFFSPGCWSTHSTCRTSVFQLWGRSVCSDHWEPSTECQVSADLLTSHTSARSPRTLISPRLFLITNIHTECSSLN